MHNERFPEDNDQEVFAKAWDHDVDFLANLKKDILLFVHDPKSGHADKAAGKILR